MNSMRKMAVLLAAGLAGVSFMAAAQQQQQPAEIAPPQRMEVGAQRRKVSLKDALQLAAKQGPDVAAARAQAAITEAGVRRAWTAWQPDISATGTFDHTSAPSSIPAGALGTDPVTGRPSPEIVIVAPNSRYATFQISQPFLSPQGLFSPGIANAAAEAARLGADQAREQILLSVAQAYLGFQGLEGLLEAAREAEKVALRREQDARARIAAGTDVEIALLRAQTETAQARAQIASIKGQQDATLPLLEALVGEAIDPLPARIEDFGPVGQESASPWENAFSVKSAISSASAAQKSVRLAQFLWLPTIAGVAKENYNSNGGFAEKNWTSDLIVNISIPLYDRGTRYAQLAEDRARLSQAQAQLASARARARSSWIGARANLEAAQAVLQQNQAQAQLATRTQVQVDASYRAGVATSLDLSDADQRKFAAQSAAAQARSQLEVRRAELAASEGRLYEAAR
jgi:outer membrane protein TolC